MENSQVAISKNKGLIFGILSVIVMSITPVMNKLSLTHINPLQASFYNCLFSFGFTVIYMLIMRKKFYVIKDFRIWLLGILNTLGILLQYMSTFYLDPVTVGLLGRFYIVFAVILSVVLLREKISKNDYLPIAFTIIGSFLVSNFSTNIDNLIGIVCALSYTFFFALTNAVAKKVIKNIDSQTILLYNQGMSAIILFAIMLLTNNVTNNINTGIGYIVISALCSGFVGLLLFYESLKYITYREANIVRASNPIFVFMFTLPFFQIPITPTFVLGGILIIFSIVWMNIKK